MYGKFDFFLILKLFFKFLVLVVVLIVVGLFLWRFTVSRVPEEMKILSPNEALSSAYADKGEALTLMLQEQNTTTRAEKNYGYFTACDAVFIPDADQLQLLIRYNDSTLEATERDYGLAEGTLDPSEDWYDVTLLVMLDKTPENKEDNLLKDLGEHRDAIGFARIQPTEVSGSMHSGLHSYRRLVFDGIDPTDAEVLAVFADFYFMEDIPYGDENFDVYTEEAYGALCLYAFTEESGERALTKKDIAALNAYAAEK